MDSSAIIGGLVFSWIYSLRGQDFQRAEIISIYFELTNLFEFFYDLPEKIPAVAYSEDFRSSL